MGRAQQKKSDEFGFAEMLTSGMLFCFSDELSIASVY